MIKVTIKLIYEKEKQQCYMVKTKERPKFARQATRPLSDTNVLKIAFLAESV